MNVLIIPEDFRNDQYILKPLFSRLFGRLGVPSVRVKVCQDPLLGGIGEALKSDRLTEIVQQYAMVDFFILCVDRDGIVGRRDRLDEIEAQLGISFFAENAWEELETWVLAGLDLPSAWRWADVRAEVDVKEHYFGPFVAQRGLSDSPGSGRLKLGDEASRRIPAIRQKCPEDFDTLAQRLETALR